MADEVDRADMEREYQLADQIRSAQKREPTYIPIGMCYYCNEDVAPGKLFCDSDCATDHSKMLRQWLTSGTLR